MELGRQDRGQIGADAEIGGVPERGEAGEAEQEIEAHRQDGEGQRARRQQQMNERRMRNDQATATSDGSDASRILVF